MFITVTMNRFRFFNVGQGLFYSGVLNNGFKFVYDCGTKSSNKLIDNAIAYEYKSLKAGDGINMVVISHFHKDHTSGIRKLPTSEGAQYILPYLSNDYDVFGSYLLIMGYSLNLIQYYWRIYNNGNIEYEEIELYSEQDFSFRHFKIIENDWCFYFLNKSISLRKEEFLIKEIKTLLSSSKCSSINEYMHYEPSAIEKLKNLYDKIFGKGNYLNLTSIVMFHHPITYNPRVSFLTGDIEMNEEMVWFCTDYLAQIKPKYTCEIDYLLIPHHGSFKNYKSLGALLNDYIYCYISCNISAKFPDSRTITDIIKHHRIPFIADVNYIQPNYKYCEYFI